MYSLDIYRWCSPWAKLFAQCRHDPLWPAVTRSVHPMALRWKQNTARWGPGIGKICQGSRKWWNLGFFTWLKHGQLRFQAIFFPNHKTSQNWVWKTDQGCEWLMPSNDRSDMVGSATIHPPRQGGAGDNQKLTRQGGVELMLVQPDGVLSCG